MAAALGTPLTGTTATSRTTRPASALLAILALLASLLALAVVGAAPVAAVAPAAGSGCTTSATTVSSSPALPIIDFAMDHVSVSGAGAYIWDVDLTTDITHTWNDDLDIVLKSPAGTEVIITTDNGPFIDDIFKGTLWDDDAGTPVTDFPHVDLVTSTPLVPEEAFGAFIGEDPNGTWTLDITDDVPAFDNGTLNSWSLDITTLPSPPLQTLQQPASAPGLAIVDLATVSDSIVIPAAPGTIADVNLFTNIFHTWNEDLDIVLKSPAGTEVTLTTDNGGDNDDIFFGTTWDDDAGDELGFVPAPVTDFPHLNNDPSVFLAPEEALGAFIGEDPTGSWTLEITDDFAGETGTLTFWRVTVRVHRCDIPAPSDQTLYAIVNDAGGGAGNASLYTLDPATGAPTLIGPTGTTSIGAIDMDPTTGKLYGNISATNTLVEINPGTGAATVVGPTGVAGGGGGNSINDFAFDLDGNLFGYRRTGDTLYSINKATGAAAPIGNPGFGFANALEFDPVAGVLRAFDFSGGNWATVSPTTAASVAGAPLWRAESGVRKSLAIDRNGKGYSIGDVFFTGSHDLLWADPAGGGTWGIGDTGISIAGDNLGALAVEKGPPVHDVGLVDTSQGIWYLRNTAGAVTSFFYGNPVDLPIAGDWDGDGISTPGLYRQSDGFFYARNTNTQGPADAECFAGNPEDVPISGDWDGDGDDNLGIYRPSQQVFYLFTITCTGSPMGAAQISFLFGNPGDKPVAGDWDGDGIDEVGLHRESTGFFYWRNTLDTGIASGEIFFGDPGDRFVAGDWGIVDGVDTPAVFRPSDSTFYFRHTLTQGIANSQFPFGESPWLPVAGVFGLG